MPLISVILPVHNCEAYLGVAIESVLDQSFGDFELIALDDGSTDRSPAILDDFARQDSRIRIVSHENRGITPTLNAGVDLACGDLIARMDGDDICLPDRFQRQVDYLAQHKDVVALGGQVLLIDGEGRKLTQMPLPCTHADIDTAHASGRSKALICHPAAMIRTNALRQSGSYLNSYKHAEDIDLWLRLAEIGELANLPDTVLQYRRHVETIGYTKLHSQTNAAWRAAKDAAARRGAPFYTPEPVVTKPQSLGDTYCRWGWWALNSGESKTARHYALKTLRHAPLHFETWKLLACSLRGY